MPQRLLPNQDGRNDYFYSAKPRLASSSIFPSTTVGAVGFSLRNRDEPSAKWMGRAEERQAGAGKAAYLWSAKIEFIGNRRGFFGEVAVLR